MNENKTLATSLALHRHERAPYLDRLFQALHGLQFPRTDDAYSFFNTCWRYCYARPNNVNRTR